MRALLSLFLLEKRQELYHRVALRRKAHVPRRYPRKRGANGTVREAAQTFFYWLDFKLISLLINGRSLLVATLIENKIKRCDPAFDMQSFISPDIFKYFSFILKLSHTSAR